jgi:hypothetical protein
LGYRKWHESTCNGLQLHERVTIVRYVQEMEAKKQRCMSYLRCNKLATSMNAFIHANQSFDHCQLAVVTSIYSTYDYLPQAPQTAYPNVT